MDPGGTVLSRHEGLADFTVGQRKGIGVATRDPLYVLKLEPSTNRVVVGSDSALLQDEVVLDEVFWQLSPASNDPLKVNAKIRYNMDAKPALLFGGNRPRLVFRDPVRAVTPGQIAVAYRGATVVAGGTIATQP